MNRWWGVLPLAVLAVAIPASAAIGIAQSPLGEPPDPWSGDRTNIPVTPDADALSLLECRRNEGMSSGIFDYAGPSTGPDPLDPIERARSILAGEDGVSAAVGVDAESARWLDLGPSQGAVTFDDARGRTRLVVRFELGSTGWLASSSEQCELA